ncbi:hypothetical protein AB0878_47525 [Amycolatopsis sp. NPDC047767]|uniref:hypothetical protein n=1 Tax=Amycolatopsis sp. NPDC047767 TaxID=3156765 RepID=UPI003456A124
MGGFPFLVAFAAVWLVLAMLPWHRRIRTGALAAVLLASLGLSLYGHFSGDQARFWPIQVWLIAFGPGCLAALARLMVRRRPARP